jgi:CBS domain-containing protein
MTVFDVMNRTPAILQATQTVAEGLALMRERRIRSLPIVDTEGRYLGLFELRDVWSFLLPRAATLGSRSLPGLAFVGASPEELRARLAAARNRPVADFAGNEEFPPVPPQTSVTEAMRLLYHHGGILPVVDPSRRLLGIVSTWEILGTLD